MMKKFYLSMLSLLIFGSAFAQVSVTFRVDMSGQTVGANGVFAAGDWQDGLPGEDGAAGDWNPTTHPMTDMGNGMYELTAEVAPGQYQFKYINSGNWEDVGATCQVGGGNGNRFFAVTSFHATDGLTLPAVRFMQCAPAGQVAVRLSVDMLNSEGLPLTIDPNGVHVAGDIVVPNWTPGFGTGYNRAGSLYQFVTTVEPNASYSYKWINGNDWVASLGDETVLGACGDGNGNRALTVTTENVSTINYCFGSCDVCVDPTEVIFRVDMNGAGMINAAGALIAGTMTNWADQPMTDEGDGIWSYTAFLSPGPVSWKFKNGPDGWEPNIGEPCGNGNDRTFDVPASEDPVEVGMFCFATCDAECDVPDPAEITFRVDMSNETISPDGVHFISGFLGWQGGALQMTDTGDNIYEVTVLYSGPANIAYKFVNGIASTEMPENEEFDGVAESPGACVVPSGVGGWNRIHTRSGEPEVRPTVFFGECGPLSTRNAMELGSVRIFPNPSNGVTFVEVENPNGYNLRMSVYDITGKVVRENVLLNNSRKEINTNNFAPGLYFLDITNDRNERSVHKLMVK